ncbi:hypothetical protein U1Q18_019720, partial [Sarracenia purpurea var. burkii]
IGGEWGGRCLGAPTGTPAWSSSTPLRGRATIPVLKKSETIRLLVCRQWRLNPRMRGGSRRTKAPLMKKMDLSKPLVSAQYEMTVG